MRIANGLEQGYLTTGEFQHLIRRGMDALDLHGKRVLVIIPDNTRTMPMPQVFAHFEGHLTGRVRMLDYLVASGTHTALDDPQLSQLLGAPVINGQVGESHVYNHAWQQAETFAHLGTITAGEISSLSGGLLSQDVTVQINRRIFDYDQLIICGPVFPHEVAGFSGGYKYFVPGIAGADIINFTHWLGALVTNFATIGKSCTPVRAVINRAASFIGIPTACFAFVVDHAGTAGLFCGAVEQAWSDAARLSGMRHIIYKARPFKQVLSCMPEMYSDLWTAAKGMYKLEPVVADGGEVVIYAPHIREVSYSHGKLIDAIGYHCRDYFLTQWERFGHLPGGVLAHSTHLKGLGAFDRETGTETPRIQVTLATGIPRERCQRLNLGYRDPASIDPSAWQGREEQGILYVPRAGEQLYRLESQAIEN